MSNKLECLDHGQEQLVRHGITKILRKLATSLKRSDRGKGNLTDVYSETDTAKIKFITWQKAEKFGVKLAILCWNNVSH